MNSEEKLLFKQKIKLRCEEIIQQRISTSSQAMVQAQESANSDEKSSAGDKHETGRAMGQIDSEMNAKQLNEAQKDLTFIQTISADSIHQKTGTGAIVVCEDFIFFIALGLGNTIVDEKKIILLSPGAPVAKLLSGKIIGECFMMNGKSIFIRDIF